MARKLEEMDEARHKLLVESRALPYDARELLAEEILEELARQDNADADPDPEGHAQAAVDASWDAEIKRRVDSVKDGTAVYISEEDYNARMDAVFAKYGVTRARL